MDTPPLETPAGRRAGDLLIHILTADMENVTVHENSHCEAAHQYPIGRPKQSHYTMMVEITSAFRFDIEESPRNDIAS
jgi:hypothetical protein